ISPSDFVISLVVPMLQDIGCKVASFYSSFNARDKLIEEIEKSDADFAAYIDSNGETLTLIDKTGNIIDDDLFLSLTSLIMFKNIANSKVVVPITAPSVIETLAKKYNG